MFDRLVALLTSVGVSQHSLGMSGLELHVVAQHWVELLRINLDVVGQGQFIAGTGNTESVAP